jgi:hypothetical protein
MGARHRVGIGLSYRPARLHRLAEFIPWNRFLGSINVSKYGLLICQAVALSMHGMNLLYSEYKCDQVWLVLGILQR